MIREQTEPIGITAPVYYLCADCNQPKQEGRFNTHYIGGQGNVLLFECDECLNQTQAESREAVERLKEVMAK